MPEERGGRSLFYTSERKEREDLICGEDFLGARKKKKKEREISESRREGEGTERGRIR